MPITWLDVVVIAFMLISGLLAMARGFTRELLSILSWVAAALLTLWAFPKYQDQMRTLLAESPKWLADIVLVFGIFLVTLIVVTFVTIRIADKILDSRIGALDRSFGFLFGLGRGLIIVVIAFLFFTWLVPEESMPTAVTQAKSRPLLEYTGESIRRMLPEDPSEAISKIKRGDEPAEEPETKPEDDDANIPDKDSRKQDSDPELGYKRTERRGLDQLLEGTRAANRQ